MQDPIHHSISGIPHCRFDPRLHSNLYLDLNNLPLNEEMQAIHPLGIPFFLYTTMVALLRAAFVRDLNTTVSFVTHITHTKIRKPTPPHPNCQICQNVTWIITSCPNPQACKERLEGLSVITIFEINREMWCRIFPKPLLIESEFLQYAEMINYPAAFLGTDFIYPLQPGEVHQLTIPQKRNVLHEWRNGLSYLAFRTLKRRGELYGRVASVILAIVHIITALQFTRIHPVQGQHSSFCYFILDTIRVWPQAYELLKTVSQAVGSAIGELVLIGEYWPGMYEHYPEDFRVEDSDWYQNRLSTCVQTMIALNNNKIFAYDEDITATFVHRPNCAISPNLCYCRFVNILQMLNPLPE